MVLHPHLLIQVLEALGTSVILATGMDLVRRPGMHTPYALCAVAHLIHYVLFGHDRRRLWRWRQRCSGDRDWNHIHKMRLRL